MLAFADAGVEEAIVLEFLAVVDVTTIDDDVAIHDFLDDIPGGHAELTPFCHEGEDIGTVGSIVEVLAVGDSITDAPAALVHGDGVEDPDGGTILQELVDDHKGRGFTHVVGLWLEAQANDGNGLALKEGGRGGNGIATNGTKGLEDLIVDDGLLTFVDTLDGFDDLHVIAMVDASVEKGLDILGEAGAAITTASIEELRANACIGAYALTYCIDIGPYVFAEVGDVVHKRDARSEHGISRIFGHLGRGDVHEDHTEVIDEEGLVETCHDLLGLLRLCAYHHTIGGHEVLDGCTFLQELRVAGHIEGDGDTTLVELFLDDSLDLLGGANRDGGLRDEDCVFMDVLSELSGDSKDVSQIGRAIFIGWRTYSREDHLYIIEDLGEVGGEVKTVELDIALDEFLETRLIDGHDAILELVDLLFIDIDTGDMGSHLSEACATDQAYIAGTYYCNIHNVSQIAQKAQIVLMSRRNSRNSRKN